MKPWRQTIRKTKRSDSTPLHLTVPDSTSHLFLRAKWKVAERKQRAERQECRELFWIKYDKRDQEGATGCVRVWEKEREWNRDGGGKRRKSLALHNKLRHECSSTLVSTHPLQFRLSNGTSHLPHPLTVCTEKERARRLERSCTKLPAACGHVPAAHTPLQASSLMKRGTCAHTPQLVLTAHTPTFGFFYCRAPKQSKRLVDRKY